MHVSWGYRSAGLFAAAILLASLAAAAAAAGCGGGQPDLSGTAWKLTGWSASSLDPADFTITADFADEEVGGKSAVNSYSGPYTASSDAAFSAGPLASTQMAGPEPAMRAEAMFFEFMDRAAAYTVNGSTLTLSDGNGNELLIFTARE
jgi:heat shock protein HslJ